MGGNAAALAVGFGLTAEVSGVASAGTAKQSIMASRRSREVLIGFAIRRAADKNLPDVRRTSLSVATFDGLGSPSYGITSSAARLR